jgi:transcriptional regulator with XRE-family HTH domain
MINSSEFGNRLKIIMDYYQISASTFADKIQVQRSSISHLLSGRNKPSLDFVMKVVKQFKEVELYWLLNGKGVFPGKVSPTLSSDNPIISKNKSIDPVEQPGNLKKDDTETGSKLERIVFFYSDGSFKEYLS